MLPFWFHPFLTQLSWITCLPHRCGLQVQLMGPDILSARLRTWHSPPPPALSSFLLPTSQWPFLDKNANQSEQVFRPTPRFSFDLLRFCIPYLLLFLKFAYTHSASQRSMGVREPWLGGTALGLAPLLASAPTGTETAVHALPSSGHEGIRHHGRGARLPLLVGFLSSFPYTSPWVSPIKQTLDLLGSSYISLKSSVISHLCICDPCTVAQPCPTLCDPMDRGPPGSSVHGISQARILEWVAISSSRGSSWPRDRTCISGIAGGFFITEPPGKPHLWSIFWRILFVFSHAFISHASNLVIFYGFLILATFSLTFEKASWLALSNLRTLLIVLKSSPLFPELPVFSVISHLLSWALLLVWGPLAVYLHSGSKARLLSAVDGSHRTGVSLTHRAPEWRAARSQVWWNGWGLATGLELKTGLQGRDLPNPATWGASCWK